MKRTAQRLPSVKHTIAVSVVAQAIIVLSRTVDASVLPQRCVEVVALIGNEVPPSTLSVQRARIACAPTDRAVEAAHMKESRLGEQRVGHTYSKRRLFVVADAQRAEVHDRQTALASF